MDAYVVPPEWNAVLNVWNAHMGVGALVPGSLGTKRIA